jgi:hypothetical protein
MSVIEHRQSVLWLNEERVSLAAAAIHESYSSDTLVLARRGLEAAVRDESDLLLRHSDPPPKPAPQSTVAMSAFPPEADIHHGDVYVG